MKEIQNLFNKVTQKHLVLSGYRINNFDIPWLVHKLNKYELQIPNVLSVYGKKPWEVQSYDLVDQWKFGFKYYNTFDEVCYELEVDSPKDEMEGSEVHGIYWNDNGLERIKNYCEKDVISSMKVAEKMLKYYVI